MNQNNDEDDLSDCEELANNLQWLLEKNNDVHSIIEDEEREN